MFAFGGISRCEQSKVRGHKSLSKHRYIHHIQGSTEPSVLSPRNAYNAAKILSNAFILPLTRFKWRSTTLSAGIVRTAHLISPIPMIVPIILLLLVPKWFISRTRRPRGPPVLQRNLKSRPSLIPSMRLSNLLIPIRALSIPELTPCRPITILNAI